MTDDWKGEHLIRGVRLTTQERHADDKRVLSSVIHEKKRRKGQGMSTQVAQANFKKPKKGGKT